MSRIGKEPIELPKGVSVKFDNSLCVVQGSKDKLELKIPQGIQIESSENKVLVKRADDTKQLKSLHGTMRVLVSNMVKGVSEGFKKELEIVGVGYKAQMKGKDLVLNVGFSHPVQMPVPQDLKVSIPNQNRILVEGIDKQKVGEFSAKIRRIYPPEPYKGKGIRYLGEEVRKKLGKALAK